MPSNIAGLLLSNERTIRSDRDAGEDVDEVLVEQELAEPYPDAEPDDDDDEVESVGKIVETTPVAVLPLS